MNFLQKSSLLLMLFILSTQMAHGEKKDSEGTTLYQTSFKNGIPAADFTNPGHWVQVKGGITSTTTGLKNYLMLFRQYSLNNRKGTIMLSMGSDTKFNFFTVEMDNFHTWGTLMQADAANGIIKVFANYNADSASYPRILVSYRYKFITGRNYTLTMMRNNGMKNFIVTDCVNGKADTVAQLEGTTGGLLRDGFAIATDSGTPPTVKAFTVSTAFTKGMRVIYLGDSITEGFYSVPDAFYQYGQAAISGRSSGNVYGAQNRILSELSLLKPRYVSILIGTNPGNTITNLTNLCLGILKLGITPVLNNLPWKYNGSVAEDNSIIAQVRKNLGLRGAAFDVATSVNSLNQQQDQSIFLDGVHPNAEGIHRMYRQLQKDVPELFE
jgi:lysophospholipase L1-like esterase